MKKHSHTTVRVLLADDDNDDRYFFDKALRELELDASLKTVEDGELLIRMLLDEDKEIPDVLFLDLNMPKKNGLECLLIIKKNERLKDLPVIIYSTSLHSDIADLLYNNGAHYYIRKTELPELKKILVKMFQFFNERPVPRPNREDFVVSFAEVDH